MFYSCNLGLALRADRASCAALSSHAGSSSAQTQLPGFLRKLLSLVQRLHTQGPHTQLPVVGPTQTHFPSVKEAGPSWNFSAALRFSAATPFSAALRAGFSNFLYPVSIPAAVPCGPHRSSFDLSFPFLIDPPKPWRDSHLETLRLSCSR